MSVRNGTPPITRDLLGRTGRLARAAPALDSPHTMDRHDLYELCVQSPPHAVALLRAIHGHEPRVLGEDFCGTAAVSREWAREKGCSAVAADIDAALSPARRRVAAPAVEFVEVDLLERGVDQRADVIFVGNFSIGEIHERAALVRYLRRSLARLNPGGVFVCDTYGGESAFRVGSFVRTHAAAEGSIVHYTWEHRSADPATGMVENAIHFRVVHAGEVVLDLPDAFVYRWRLWSIPELRDAMGDAGFTRTSVHRSLEGQEEAGGLPSDYIVCVAAFKE